MQRPAPGGPESPGAPTLAGAARLSASSCGMSCAPSSRPRSAGLKSVTFDLNLERYPVRASPAGADRGSWQTGAFASELHFGSDVSTDSSAGPETRLEAFIVLQENSRDKAASARSTTADGASSAQEDGDDISLAEIEAYANEQASRLTSLMDKRRARRTATVSTGRTRQVEGISFQVKTSTLWQRRGFAE
ncbi:unnamed protein product [Prorocentrum cordatum]|uniref:Uncharacterized protein n=1 Tax=Prorocentrum cordatum TaxID=2364126 RepID=A0ABN9VXX7_9DINO|nr:unnamed protein product [Polarella glacialis]